MRMPRHALLAPLFGVAVCGQAAASSSSAPAAVAKTTLATKLSQLDATVTDSIHDKVDALLDAKHKYDDDTFDYVVVGGGPGGISVATALSAVPSNRVLLLEAGEDRDADMPIADSTFAWILPVEYVPEYMWQMVSKPNEFEFDPDGLPPNPGRRRALLEYHHHHHRTLLSQPSSPHPGRHLLHGDMAETGAEQYMGGRLLGGGTSINGEQAVWPTARLLTAISDYLGGDPAWAPDAVYALLRNLETYSGNSTQPRGASGPLDVKQAPSNPTADGLANDFVDALEAVFGPGGSAGFSVPTVEDYNDPDTPLSIFSQWQLTQQPGGDRASASTALLTPAVRARPNLVIRTRATAMRVLFDTEGGTTPRARGVEYTQSGTGKVAVARREVIVSAGHRSSLLLEASGVGNPSIIGPLLGAVGRKVVVPLPGVGENLGNDGIVMVVLNATGAPGASGGAFVPSNLYGGGAFLPWPNPASSPGLGTSARFTQLIGAPGIMDAEYGLPTFTIAPILLNTTSRGSAHIQSADPLYEPLVELKTFNSLQDQANWLYAIKNQTLPVVDAMLGAGYTLLSPAPDVLDGSDVDATLDWVFSTYVPSHHWFGTCAMGTDPGGGAVVDGAGRVHGTRGLRVADASIYPFKLDGNTGMPAYVAGGVVAQAILDGR